MKKFLVNLVLGAALLGCSPDKPTLHVFNWSDYIDQDVICQFEEAYDCKVVVDSFDDNEAMLAKLMAGGSSGYDVIFPSSYIVPVMMRNNLIQPLNMTLLPNVAKNLDMNYQNTFTEFVGKYSVPYGFSMTGIAYRTDKIDPSQVTNSWEFLKHPAFTGRVSLLNDIRDMFAIGLKMHGYSVNSTDSLEVAGALDYILDLKRRARKLDSQLYRVGLANGEFYVCVGYSSDVRQIIQENADVPIKFFIPDEGAPCCWDEMVIAANAPQPRLAHAFINFLYDSKVAAQNVEAIDSVTPNKGMLEYMDEADRTNDLVVISQEVLQKLEPLNDLRDGISIYNKAWDVFTTKNVGGSVE